MESKVRTQDENIAYWDSRASVHRDMSTATFPDIYLREREIDHICGYIGRLAPTSVLDIGCGNGYGTFKYAVRFPNVRFRGEDLSTGMIGFALDNLGRLADPLGNLSFGVGDVTCLSHADGSYDMISTCRVLINLGAAERQLVALREIQRVLKPGGVYVMLESFKQSYAKLNTLRAEFGLAPLVPHEMNLYMDEDQVREWCSGLLTVVEENPFSSTYYIGSRVAYPLILGPEGKPNHEHPVNRLFAQLDSIGDCGRERILLLRKKT
jgi:ubiquinone/menaquinone biosynthesis C-methylase UbiE